MNRLHDPKAILVGGAPLETAQKVMVLVHGRGANAQGMLGLARELRVAEFAWLAPQASNYTWYPYSFLAPVEQNEPWLSSALEALQAIRQQVHEAGRSDQDIYWLGFSQGACLVAEFCARHAAPYGGVFVLTGGLIGQSLRPEGYSGSFQGCPAFFGTSDVDPHVPESRVRESAEVYARLGASVTLRVYPDMPHTVTEEEIAELNTLLMANAK